ncbi:Protein of unknown function DUF456 [Syntrophomonas zehnderi OL-4]|uniref:DUF456 domain-containing protein n=1 Tax=Syntrophomonas zehnderi OL-4 TaxID=690567 RepID=A0A0E4GAF3_9FIRM|nr:DUF456 domain-containing protein [Syntrophomonas zehnderi]CFX44959.1 Protein of unknown function DUF456 [Syntrophomonas zehnderi OL-4]
MAIIGILLGIAGTIIPFIPGIPLIFIAILGYGWYEGFHSIGTTYLAVMGGLAILSLAVEYLSSTLGAKYYGSTKNGVIGALIGTMAGIFIFPPLGILVGPWIGAVMGEVLAGKDIVAAVRIGLGTIVGIFSGLLFNLLIGIIMLISFLVVIF